MSCGAAAKHLSVRLVTMVAPDASLPLRMTQRERLLRTLEHGQHLRRGFEQGEDVAVEVLEISLHPIGSDGWAAQEFDAASMPVFVGFSTVGGEKGPARILAHALPQGASHRFSLHLRVRLCQSNLYVMSSSRSDRHRTPATAGGQFGNAFKAQFLRIEFQRLVEIAHQDGNYR